LKERYKGRDKEEEDVSNYWVTLKKSEGTGMGKNNRQIALYGKPLWQTVWACRQTDYVILDMVATTSGGV